MGNKQNQIVENTYSQTVEYTDQQQNTIKDKFREFMRNKIVLAIVSIVFGLILIVWQHNAVDSLVRILGIIMLAVAAVLIIMYVTKKEEKKGARLAAGIILAILGAFFLIKPDFIVDLFPFFMGLILVISAIMDLVGAIGLPKGAYGKTGMVVVSLIIAALGVLCMFSPGFMVNILTVFIGILFLVNGVFDLIMLALQNAGKRA